MEKNWKRILAQGKSILLFDGVCNLCNSTVQFILKRDHKAQIVFAALQSKEGIEIQKHFGLAPQKLDTLVFVQNEKVLLRSSAALSIFSKLGGFWKLSNIFWIIPSFIRDAIYDFIANHRYRWFGKEETCLLPRPEWKERFL